MAGETGTISSASRSILKMIAAGNSYEQILADNPELTYLDIFASAREALNATTPSGHAVRRVERARQRYGRTYEQWTEEEDRSLRELVASGVTVARMVRPLQRRRSAIRSRIVAFRLAGALNPKDQAWMRRNAPEVDVDR